MTVLQFLLFGGVLAMALAGWAIEASLKTK